MNLQLIVLKDIDKHPGIFSDIAQQAADHIKPKPVFNQRTQKEEFKNRDANKSSQLRKFYDELAMWDDKIHRAKNKQEEYAKSAPFIHMLKAKAAYAQGRGHVDKNFIDIFNRLMTQIDNPDTLRHAKLFFEAMLGFRKAAESK